MIRLVGTVTYADGRVEEIECGQREFAAWERFALRAGLPVSAEQAPPVYDAACTSAFARCSAAGHSEIGLILKNGRPRLPMSSFTAPDDLAGAGVPPTQRARLVE